MNSYKNDVFYYHTEKKYHEALTYRSELQKQLKTILCYEESFEDDIFTISFEIPKLINITEVNNSLGSEKYENSNFKNFNYYTQFVFKECTLNLNYTKFCLEIISFFAEQCLNGTKIALNLDGMPQQNPKIDPEDNEWIYINEKDTCVLNWIIKYLSKYEINFLLIFPKVNVIEIPESSKVKVTLLYYFRNNFDYKDVNANSIIKFALEELEIYEKTKYQYINKIIIDITNGENQKYFINKLLNLHEATIIQKTILNFVYTIIYETSFNSKFICFNSNWSYFNQCQDDDKKMTLNNFRLINKTHKSVFNLQHSGKSIIFDIDDYFHANISANEFCDEDYLMQSIRNIVYSFKDCEKMLLLIEKENQIYDNLIIVNIQNYINKYRIFFTKHKTQETDIHHDLVSDCAEIFKRTSTCGTVLYPGYLNQFLIKKSLSEVSKQCSFEVYEKLRELSEYLIKREPNNMMDNFIQLIDDVTEFKTSSSLEIDLYKISTLYQSKDFDSILKNQRLGSKMKKNQLQRKLSEIKTMKDMMNPNQNEAVINFVYNSNFNNRNSVRNDTDEISEEILSKLIGTVYKDVFYINNKLQYYIDNVIDKLNEHNK
ncbi:hypothetical protein COBT_002487, partial [Conglomerata obtusa]